MNWIIYLVSGIVAGAAAVSAVSFLNRRRIMRDNAKMVSDAKKESEAIIKEAKLEAESIKKDKILQAKEKFLELTREDNKSEKPENIRIRTAHGTERGQTVADARRTEKERKGTRTEHGRQ